MAQDYCPINQHTPHDQYGLHRLEETFQKVGKAIVFSKLDLQQGFLRVPIATEDQAKTCYWIGIRVMLYLCMPYGLRNAPASVLRPACYGHGHSVVAYIDDVLVWSESPEQHVQDVAAVLDMLCCGCKLCAHPDKSIFGADVIKYLAHNLNTHGISPHR